MVLYCRDAVESQLAFLVITQVCSDPGARLQQGGAWKQDVQCRRTKAGQKEGVRPTEYGVGHSRSMFLSLQPASFRLTTALSNAIVKMFFELTRLLLTKLV